MSTHLERKIFFETLDIQLSLSYNVPAKDYLERGTQMEICRMSLLLDLREYYTFRLTQHAADFMLTAARTGHETHFNENKQRLTIVDDLILEAEGLEG